MEFSYSPRTAQPGALNKRTQTSVHPRIFISLQFDTLRICGDVLEWASVHPARTSGPSPGPALTHLLHLVPLFLLVGVQNGTDLVRRFLPDLLELRKSIFARQRGVLAKRHHLLMLIFEDGLNFGFLFIGQMQPLAEAFQLLLRAELAAHSRPRSLLRQRGSGHHPDPCQDQEPDTGYQKQGFRLLEAASSPPLQELSVIKPECFSGFIADHIASPFASPP